MAAGSIATAAAIMCLAKNIYFEANNQSIQGQLAVAAVTLNRVYSEHYPDTVCEVVHQRNQFSWYWDGKSDVPANGSSWETAIDLSMYALGNSGFLHREFQFDMSESLNYHAAYVDPHWSYLVEIGRIEQHIFYKRK